MDQFEKVEKLVQRANVSYEEAKAALEASGWDMLDAMILLEKQGKTIGPEHTEYSTGFETHENSLKVMPSAEEQGRRKNRDNEGPAFMDKVRELLRKSDDNHLIMSHYDRKIFEMPIWLMVIVLLFTWEIVWILFIVSLFMGCRYSFAGPSHLEPANKAMSTVENVAESIKDSIKNSGNTDEQ